MSPHTPGPWKIARQGVSPGWLIYSDFERQPSGTMHYIAQNLTHHSDARLVAKVLEMKAALAQALDALYQKAGEDGNIDFWNRGGPGFEACEALSALLREIEEEKTC